jgi:Zn-dependent protease with chaperone function
MISPYSLRLLLLCFAAFFLVHAALSLAARAVAPGALRLAQQLRPRAATRLLLTLRLLPLLLSLFVVLGLCLPSYLWLEPADSGERVGVACLLAAALGIALWSISLARVFRSAALSFSNVRRWRRLGAESRLEGSRLPVLVLDGEAPLLALAGLLRPRIVISRGVLRALTPEQLDAALGHECEHWSSRDNLKRLLLLLAPDALPFTRIHAMLDRSWARFSEWAADDRAVEGNCRRSLSLASALVRVARTASLVDNDEDLSLRVDRLLHASPRRENSLDRLRPLLAGAALATIAAATALLLHPATLYSVHRLLEHLVR